MSDNDRSQEILGIPQSSMFGTIIGDTELQQDPQHDTDASAPIVPDNDAAAGNLQPRHPGSIIIPSCLAILFLT